MSQLSLALSNTGVNLRDGLLNIPAEAGYRAFDVFYYLLTSASTPAEREFLGLKEASAYSILNKSGTYDPPSYLPTADDAAAAEDFRAGLKAIGIRGAAHRSLISVLAALLKLGNASGFLVDEEELESVCEDVGGLLNIDPHVLLRDCTTDDRESLISGIYEALLDWVISKANEAIASELQAAQENDSTDDGFVGDTVCLTVVDVPDPALGKAIALRGVFDDSTGINAEMIDDGIDVVSPGHAVLTDMKNAVSEVEVALGDTGSSAARDYEYQRDKLQGVLEKVGVETEPGSYLRQVLYPIENESIALGKYGRFDLSSMLGGNRMWYHISIHPTDDSAATLGTLPSVTSAWSAGTISRQLREWRLPEWANRRNKHLDYTSDFDVDEFVTRYSRLGCQDGRDGVENWIIQRGWSNGEVIVGKERIWMREGAWWEAESMFDLKPQEELTNPFTNPMMTSPFDNGYEATPPPTNPNTSGFFPPLAGMGAEGSRENLLYGRNSSMVPSAMAGSRSIAPTAQTMAGDYGLGGKGDQKRYDQEYENDIGQFTGQLDAELGDPKKIEHKTIPLGRRIWVGFVWLLTFWIPSFALRYIGRMKRPDVRMAWREKVTLMAIIVFINCFIIFYIIFFGMVICPNKDKAWNPSQVAYHTGDDDFYVSLRGKVYDISKFWKLQHSDTAIKSRRDLMEQLAGKNLDPYFPIPMDLACPGFEIDPNYKLQFNDTGALEIVPQAEHISGSSSPYRQSALYEDRWYPDKFLPKMEEFYKGDLVHSKSQVRRDADEKDRQWVIIEDGIYDLTDYFYTANRMEGDGWAFLPKEVTDLIQGYAGSDITEEWGELDNSPAVRNSLNCMKQYFYVGRTDFRESGKCTFNNWILLAFTILVCAVILVKFVAALQLGSKRKPVMQDKFVVCMVPAYTEGEDQLRKGLDSLTALQYDNKRKLMFIVCDGMIIGGGNDRPTPKIVLDILGVDPKVDPPALPFKSVGVGSEQLNYGKVYSGLYEYEGNVVPYVVVVKVGKDSEQGKTKPGNRGKRDSQVLVLNFLNRVHHRSPMSPLELEVFHQINNVIGVDPELYEYILMVDADTSVREDSLNRLVASCANDAKIAGICGETSLQNEERSWWTMIQVYEYYISHHLAKAFESLFGSVTCLPGWYVISRIPTMIYSFSL